MHHRCSHSSRSAGINPQTKTTERGITLVELMVVVAIISILTGSALFLVRGRPGLEQAATDLANKIREGSRKAVAGGTVNQSLTDGAPAIPPAARSRVAIAYDSTSKRQFVTVEVRDESLTPDGWFEISRSVLGEDVGIVSFVPELVLTNSNYGAMYGTGPGSGTPLTNTPTNLASSLDSTPSLTFKELYFLPDGSADGMANNPASAITLFLLYKTGQQERRMRVVLLPLQSSPIILPGW